MVTGPAVVVVAVVVTGSVVVMTIPVVVNYQQASCSHESKESDELTKGLVVVVDVGLVVTVPVVGKVVVVVVVDDTAGFQMLNTQYVGSVTGADSGPAMIDHMFYVIMSMNTFTHHKRLYHLQHLQSQTTIVQ